ncbi:unnamed protein product [Effrenium voratum]|nr:unnamed protein product [Effrenium voratum]
MAASHDLVEVLPLEFTREVELLPLQCAVVPKALCGELMKLLAPLSEDLKHLKRVRPGPELAVLLAEAEVPDEAQALLKRHDIEQVTVQVPRFSPLTAAQLESYSRHWPVKLLKSSFEPMQLTQEMREHFTCLLRHAEAAGGCAIARGDNVLAEASEAPEALPLKHPAMVAIEQVAAKARQRYAEQGKRSREEDEDYLCQDCDVVLTCEPCVMCAMALIHSRVRCIAFRDPDAEFGGLGGRVALHHCKSLNHHPRVLRWEKGMGLPVNGYFT